MTSAPRSTSIRPQWGPASTRDKSSTRTPSSGPLPIMVQNVGRRPRPPRSAVRERDGVDDAGGGRRGLRPELTPQLVAGLRQHYGLDRSAAIDDLGGSANLNLLVDDGGTR